MSTKVKKQQEEQKRHDRSATIQWVAISLVIALALMAAPLFTGDNTLYNGGYGVHN